MLQIDSREKGLIELLEDVEVRVTRLPVGEIVCTYGDGSPWVAERKSARDLAATIVDGRLSDQTIRLHESGHSRIFWLVEGELDGHSVPYSSMLGASLNMALRESSHLLRSVCLVETAAIVRQLLQKVSSLPGMPDNPLPKPEKRKREEKIVFLRQLMCVPGISQRIANELMQRYSKLPVLQQALGDKDFPAIVLDGRNCVGPRRLRELRKHFLGQD